LIFEQPTIGVIGLGYVGLPTSLAFHNSGFNVIGLDANREIIEKLLSGTSHLEDASSNHEIPINSPNWKITSDYEKIVNDADIFLISVPTPTNAEKKPKLDYVESAFRSIMKNLPKKSGKIIVLESTVYPGVTSGIATKIAYEFSLIENDDFFLAYSPERVSPGDVGKSAEDVARIVGCDNVEIGEYLSTIYNKITSGGCKYVGKIKVAEAAKMVENTQRDIDLAFVNELARVLPKIGVNADEVLEAASTKWNFHKHDPGIGVGGHCIPVDPYYYIELCNSVGESGELSRTARRINEEMPKFAVSEILRITKGELRSVLILGYSYKPEVGDTRETPVKNLILGLAEKNVEVRIWDPYVTEEGIPDVAKFEEDVYKAAEGVDVIILATAHEKCINLNWEELSDRVKSRILYDGRGKLSDRGLIENGWEYHGIGVSYEMGPL
tara:strand:- start:511 stop:1830 length:1320 start_codon:yes stop_codon:yes gene_type:complete